MWAKCAAVLTLAVMASSSAHALDPVTLLFNDRPPFKMRMADGSIGGTTARPAAEAFTKAGIPFVWQEVPAARQIDDVKRSAARVCAVGFYMTPERETFAKFTKAVSGEDTYVVFARKGFPAADGISIDQLLANPAYTLVVKKSNSYGPSIDAAIAAARATIDRNTGNYDTLVQMVIHDHADFTFITPEEIDYYRNALHFDASAFRVVKVTGMPHGDRRHVMCSKLVEDEVIARVNAVLPRE